MTKQTKAHAVSRKAEIVSSLTSAISGFETAFGACREGARLMAQQCAAKKGESLNDRHTRAIALADEWLKEAAVDWAASGASSAARNARQNFRDALWLTMVPQMEVELDLGGDATVTKKAADCTTAREIRAAAKVIRAEATGKAPKSGKTGHTPSQPKADGFLTELKNRMGNEVQRSEIVEAFKKLGYRLEKAAIEGQKTARRVPKTGTAQMAEQLANATA